MLEADLQRQLTLYASLLRRAPYSKWVSITDMSVADIVAYAESMNVLRRHPHAMGDVLSMTEQSAVEMTYFRNNILHLMVLPSALASCFLNNRQVRTEDLQRLAWRIYPYLCDELFLRWNEDELTGVVQEILQDFAAHGLLESVDDGASWSRPPVGAAEAMQLSVLGQLSMQIVTLLLAIALLLKPTVDASVRMRWSSNVISWRSGCPCCTSSTRPSSSIKACSRIFWICCVPAACLRQCRRTADLHRPAVCGADDAQLVLHEQIRNSILQVTPASAVWSRDWRFSHETFIRRFCSGDARSVFAAAAQSAGMAQTAMACRPVLYR
jgi:glycerol-3-phosphate O-acyltransferase